MNKAAEHKELAEKYGVKLVEYVDPFPGKKGDERVKESCWKCDGTGYYNAPSGYTWHANGKSGALCFDCNGAGSLTVKVSSVRARERRNVTAINEASIQDAIYAEQRAEREAEQARRDAERAARAAEKLAGSQHFGTVGEKTTVTGTVTKHLTVDGLYGVSHMIVLDVDGSGVFVFSTAEWARKAEEGATLTMIGEVKEHSEFNNVRQTKLGGRIKLLH